MSSSPVRDFVGYGARPPNPGWPGDARLAVNFVLNFEEGSERSIADGDSVGESAPELPSPVPAGQRDLATESMFEYGSRVGFWRLHRIFVERELPLTVFACALALERNPEAAAAFGAAGWDVCCHGRRWAQHFLMSEEKEREEIAAAVASLTRTTGAPPTGWYCRFGPSEATRALLVDHGGFVYDSDAYNDELPYWVQVAGQDHLVVPYTLTHNDAQFSRGALATGASFFAMLREAFDLLHAEGFRSPKMMSIGLHMRIAGHPGRAAGLQRFLDYVQAHRDVWICGRLAIAQHWRTHHPRAAR